MSLTHSQEPLNALLSRRAAAAGGTAFVLVGSDVRARDQAEPVEYYAGAHRPPTHTPLEAALTWLADPNVYHEVRIFCGCRPNGHLPQWTIKRGEKSMMLGVDEPLAFSIFGGKPAPTAVPRATAGAGSIAERLNAARGLADPARNPYALTDPGKLRTLNERLEYLLAAFERDDVSRKTLFLVDESWLSYDAQFAEEVLGMEALVHDERFKKDLPPSGRHAQEIKTHFAAMPAACARRGITVVLLMSEQRKAEAFRDKRFSAIRIRDRESGVLTEQVPANAYQLHWDAKADVPLIHLPRALRNASSGIRFAQDADAGETHSLLKCIGQLRLLPDEDPLDELRRLIGMSSVITQLRRWQREITYGSAPLSHLRLVGNPGTGKTTVAAIIARCLRRIGALPTENCINAGPDKVLGQGQYAGVANANMLKLLTDAQGGVLFLDEFYKLKDSPFWDEISGVLLIWTTDPSKQFVAILAGYEDKIEEALATAKGGGSRFDTTIFMPDYTADELWEIANDYAQRIRKMQIEATAKSAFVQTIEMLRTSSNFDYANARTAISLVKKAASHALDRLPETDLREASIAGSATISEADFLKVNAELSDELSRRSVAN